MSAFDPQRTSARRSHYLRGDCHVSVNDRSRRQNKWRAISLLCPPRKYNFDFARAGIDDGNELLDDNVTAPAKLRCQFFGIRGKGVEWDLRRHDAANDNWKGSFKRRCLFGD